MKTKKEIIDLCLAEQKLGKYNFYVGSKWIYVCKNDGVFHRGTLQGQPGCATFMGAMDFDCIQDFIDANNQ